MSQTIFPTVAQLCQNFEVPFVFHANIPADADWPAIQENAYYTGAVISQEYAAGAAMGELGLADGNQTAIIPPLRWATTSMTNVSPDLPILLRLEAVRLFTWPTLLTPLKASKRLMTL